MTVAGKQQGQTCPKCFASGLHPKATKCRHCGSSLERPLPIMARFMILGVTLIGAVLAMGLIYAFAHGMQSQIVCNASRAASKAC